MTDPIRIPNIENYIENYTAEIINGDLILTPKKQYMTENELMTQITHSTIEECIIKKEGANISTKTNTSYRSVLVDIWKSMPRQNFKHTTFNFKVTNEFGYKGYKWCDDIYMSFQNKDARGTLKEIIKMVKVNNLTIDLFN